MIIQAKGDVITLKGALVENQWTAIKSAVGLLLDAHASGVIVDASGLTDVTESGARTFLDASNFIQAQNARVVVAGMPEDLLAEIRKMPGVRSQLVVASSVDEARASLKSGGQTAILPVGKAKPAVLAPLIGLWPRALGFAAAEALSRKAELHLLYVLQIPRNLPLGVPVPALEKEAQDALSRAEKMVRRRGLRVRILTTRARDMTDGAARFAAESKPGLLLVAYSKEDIFKEGMRCPMVSTLCHDAPCDVAVYCVEENE